MLAVTETFACTGVYVGTEASADGTTIIARSNDVHPTVMPTIVKVYDRVENEPGRVFECRNGFSWPLSDTTYRYVCIPLTTVDVFFSAAQKQMNQLMDAPGLDSGEKADYLCITQYR